MKKGMSRLFTLVLSFALIMTGFTFFGGAAAVNATDGETSAPVVTFDVNGGNALEITTANTVDGKLETLPTATHGTEGMEFIAWYRDSGEKVTTDTVFGSDETVSAHWVDVTAPWDVNDFTYGDYNNEGSKASYQIGNDSKTQLVTTFYVITGFSDAGLKKLETNKDLVLPAADASGKKVQGVGPSAFKQKGLTSVVFPETEKVPNTIWTETGVETRGDFVICSNAFSKNSLTELTIPEGVLVIEMNAFVSNSTLTKVSLPTTLLSVQNVAFGKCAIELVKLPKTTDFGLFLGMQAFAVNKIKSVILPENTLVVNKWAFLQNTGMEAVTEGTAAEKKGGIVNMYFNENDRPSDVACVDAGTSNVQNVVVGEAVSVDAQGGTTDSPVAVLEDGALKSLPEATRDDHTFLGWYDAPKGGNRITTDTKLNNADTIYAQWENAAWDADNFTYSEDGTTITGLSDAGRERLKTDSDMIMPDTYNGVDITAIGAGVTGLYKLNGSDGQIGTFGFNEDGISYVPENVTFPAKLKTIGDYAFTSAYDNTAQKGLKALALPDTLEEIGVNAFAGILVEEVTIPDSVKSIGTGAFTTAQTASVKIRILNLPETAAFTVIPQACFANQAIETLEIPAGVTEIGRTAFSENAVTTLTLHEGLETIGRSAFQKHQLQSLTIPKSVKLIDQSAFKVDLGSIWKSTLATLTIPEDSALESIGKSAFEGSALETADIPASVKTLNKDAFKGNTDGQGGTRKVILNLKNEDQFNGEGDYTGFAADGSGHRSSFNGKMNYMISFDTARMSTKADAYTKNGVLTDNDLKAPSNSDKFDTFEGWYTAAEGGEKVDANKVYEEDTTLYAHWSNPYADATAALEAAKTAATAASDAADTAKKSKEAADAAAETPGEAAAAAAKTAAEDAQAASDAANVAKTAADTAKTEADEAVAYAEEKNLTATYKNKAVAVQTDAALLVSAAETAVSDAASALAAANEAYSKAQEEAALAAAKTDAADKLDSLLAGKQEADYDAADWEALNKAVTEAKTAVGEATTTDAVEAALNAAMSSVNSIKTKAQKAADKKAAAEAKARTVKTVTVNAKTVSAAAVNAAVKAAGGSKAYVTKIVIGKNAKKISSSAFKGYSKVKTIEVRTRKLTKKSVKKSLKGSKITVVKVNVGNTKADRNYVKKYKKIFTKKIAGKKVTVKR